MKINSDGVFTIQKGQGLTQAIAKEIGLSNEQMNKLGNSIWTQVMDEVDRQKVATPDLYSGGNDINGDSNSNFIVKTGQVVTISLAGIWDKILNIVNNALGTNFSRVDKEEDYDMQMSKVNQEKASKNNNIPPSNKELAEIYNNEQPHPELANSGEFKDNLFINYDSNGYVRSVFKDNKLSVTIERDENGNIRHIDKYDISNDDQNSVRYNSNGDVISYSVKQGNNRIDRDNEGHITGFIHHSSESSTYTSFQKNENYSFETMVSCLLDEEALNGPDKCGNTNPLPSNKELAEIYNNEQPHPELANSGEFKDNLFINYDSNGYVRSVFEDNKLSVTIERDENGNIRHIDKYDISNDGQNSVRYNSNGDVISYSIKQGNNRIDRDNEGHITGFIHHSSESSTYIRFQKNENYSFETMVSCLLGEEALNETEKKN